MLFSELYKIMVNKVSFVGCKGSDRRIEPLDPLLMNAYSKKQNTEQVNRCPGHCDWNLMYEKN